MLSPPATTAAFLLANDRLVFMCFVALIFGEIGQQLWMIRHYSCSFFEKFAAGACQPQHALVEMNLANLTVTADFLHSFKFPAAGGPGVFKSEILLAMNLVLCNFH